MAKITHADRLSIRTQAERFLETHGFSTPPLPPDQALAARNLEVSQLSLDDLLVNANLAPQDHQKIQAMLNANTRSVLFKRGLPQQKKQWGSLHEVGHEFLPWQRELLYCCPLLLLPPNVQEQFEGEADLFAAESFFFGDKFHKQAFSGDLSLTTAIELATDVYQTSLHATFAHYVEESPQPHCLLVWKPKTSNGSCRPSEGLALHYYVKSKGFNGHVSPGQNADPDGIVNKLLNEPSLGVVRHELRFPGSSGQGLVAQAESFSNSYNVFTLISQPTRRSVQAVGFPSVKYDIASG